MSFVQSVSVGELQTAAAPTVLETVGVGSCLAIVLHDPIACIGGMAHAMLPVKPATEPSILACRYVDESILTLIGSLLKMGVRRDRLIAKLVGGAHMFALFGDAAHGIGAQNVEQARKTLAEQNIPIVAEETGGNVGRTIHFDLASGVCSVESHL